MVYKSWLNFLLVEAYMCAATLENCFTVYPKLHIHLPIVGNIQVKEVFMSTKRYAPECLWQLFIEPETGSSSDVHQRKMNSQTAVYLYNGIPHNSKKGQAPDTCNNMDESQKQRVEQKKPDKKDTVWFHLHFQNRQSDSVTTEVRTVFICSVQVSGYRVNPWGIFLDVENVLSCPGDCTGVYTRKSSHVSDAHLGLCILCKLHLIKQRKHWAVFWGAWGAYILCVWEKSSHGHQILI